ncbi:MAG TPA: tetratricopeptide repeat protein [Candidatus Omnitrophota bacterium]|nr:tetratricopeptide repeat protein [Candidatus Omnitrophota bacterium]
MGSCDNLDQKLGVLGVNAGKYVPGKKSVSDLSDIQKLIDIYICDNNYKNDPNYKQTVIKIFARYVERLNNEKNYSALGQIMSALGGGAPSTPSNITDLAKIVGVTSIDQILAGPPINMTPGDIAYMKAEIYKNTGNYTGAIMQYKAALAGTPGPYFNYINYAKINLVYCKIKTGDHSSAVGAEFRDAMGLIGSTGINAADFYRGVLTDIAKGYAGSESVESLKTALDLFKFLNGESSTCPLPDFAVAVNPAAPGKYSEAVAGLMLKVGKYTRDKKMLEDAQKYCLAAGILGGTLQGVLWEKINLEAKDSPDSLPDRLQLAYMMKLSLDGAAGVGKEPWASANVVKKDQLLAAKLVSADQLKDRMDLAYLLDSIATISKKNSKTAEYDPEIYKKAATAEYAAGENLALNAIAKQPKSATNYLRLAMIYEKIGDASADTNPTDCLKYMNRAGYIYQMVLNGDVSFSADDMETVKKMLQSNAAATQKSLPDNSKEKYLVMLRYASVILRVKLTMSTSQNAQEIIDIHGKLMGKYDLISSKLTDADSVAAISAGKMEADRVLAMSLIKLKQIDRAIEIFKKNIVSLLSGSAPNYNAALGNISTLAWAYDLKAADSKDASNYQRSAALFNALLYGKPTDIADLKPVVDAIVAKQKELIEPGNLGAAKISLGQLHLAYGKALINCGKLDDAYGEFQLAIDAFKTDASPAGQARTLEALYQLLALRTKKLMDEGKYGEALALIEKENLSVYDAQVATAIQSGTPEEMFSSVRTLAWIYGMKGNIQDKLLGEGAGKESYLKAIALFKTILSNTRTSDPAFLTSMSSSREDLLLSMAGYLQSAGVNDASITAESLKYYGEALKTLAATDPRRVNANLGKAEVLLKLHQLDPSIVKEDAGSALAAAFTDIKLMKFDSDTTNRTAFRFIRALNWLFSETAESKKAVDKSYYPGKLYPEQCAILVITRALLKNDDAEKAGGRWTEINKSAATAFSGLKIDPVWIKNVIMAGGTPGIPSKLLSPKVLSASGVDLWSIRFEYIGNLLSAELYSEAVDEYNLAVEQIAKQKEFGGKELEFLTNIHSAIGDIYCFKIGRFEEARQAYDKAVIAIAAAIAKQAKQPAPTAIDAAFTFINGNLNLISVNGGKELLAIYLRMLNGYGKIYLENGDADKAIASHKKVVEILTAASLPSGIAADPRSLATLTSAYLSLADIYSYKLNNDGEALRYYNLARTTAEKLPDKSLSDRNVAQAYAGIGDIYRLRKFDYKSAIEQYDKAIKLLEAKASLGNEDKKLLYQLYANKAISLAQEGDFKGAGALIRSARDKIGQLNTEFDPDLQKTKDRIENSMVLINQKNLSALSSVWFRGAYVVDTYEGSGGKTRASGFVPMASAEFQLTNGFSLKLDYMAGLEREFTFKTAGLMDPATRLKIDRPHTASLRMRYNYEGDSYNFRASPSFLVNAAKYTVNAYSWNNDFSSYYGVTPNSSTFYSTYLALSLGMDYKLPLSERGLMMFGFDLDSSVRLAGNSSPLTAAGKQDINEFPQLTDAERNSFKDGSGKLDTAKANAAEAQKKKDNQQNLDDSTSYRLQDRFSFAFNPYLRYIYRFNLGDSIVNTSFALGAGVEFNPQAITVNGLWPLDRTRSYWRGYGSGAADVSFFFGNEKRWNVPFSFSGKLGNMMYVQGDAGIGYYGDGWGLKGVLGISHFDDRLGSQNTTATLGLGGFF